MKKSLKMRLPLKNLSITLSTVIVIMLTAMSIHAGDIQDGFLGIKWGTNIAELKGFSRLYSKSHVNFYVKPNEVHTIDNIMIPHVVYGFYSEKFFAVYISIEKMEVFSEIKRYMKSRYGVPKKTSFTTKSDQRIDQWKYKDVKIKLKLNEKDGKMKLAFYYTPLAGEVNEAQQEEYHESSIHFLPIEKGRTPTAIPLLRF